MGGCASRGHLWSFATGLAGGAAYCVYHESLDFSHNIAAIAGNVTIAGVAFLSAKELTRLVRQTDDWVNSATAGALVGSQLAVMQRGPRYSAAGAALCGGVAAARSTTRGNPTRDPTRCGARWASAR